MPHSHVFIDPSEIMALPASGPAWDALVKTAGTAPYLPDLSNQDDDTDSRMFAGALVAVRKSDTAMHERVREGCIHAMETENGGRTLAAGRNIGALVAAADLAYVRQDFEPWLEKVLREELSGKTIISTHEDRPNNWGTHAGASRIAANLYLSKSSNRDVRRRAATDFRAAVKVLRGWLGDRDAYTGFEFSTSDLAGKPSWQADPANPVGINPVGATIQSKNVDGVLPDDQRRGGGFTFPFPKENYVWEALQGAFAQAHMVARVEGLEAWKWSNKALLRAVTWLHVECKFPAQSDDTWIPHLVNKAYGTTFPAPTPSQHGKAFGAGAEWMWPKA